ncbi:hypothetical protein BSKO_06994 [Bryopsis sp. KO-2023]|nr:hypothetical protein BSKO_06994 [Bryopsis sp. KO-2023]
MQRGVVFSSLRGLPGSKCGPLRIPLPVRQRAHLGVQYRNVASRASDSEEVDVGWLWSGTSAATPKILRRQGIKPKRSLGQNFVTDDGVLGKLVSAAGVVSGEPVLELGPGTGNLTKHLIQAGAVVTAVEKDDTLQTKLVEEFGDDLHVIHGDIMKVDFVPVVEKMLEDHPDMTRVRVVANLPYNITTDCLRRLLPMSDIFSHLCFMIQDEVAKRLCLRKPGGTQYRSMTIFTQYYSDPTYKMKISKGVYYPQPKVDGALVDFAIKTETERMDVGDDKTFISMVNKSFAEKRKKISNSLTPMYPSDEVHSALRECGLPETSRAEELTVENFVELYRCLAANR